MSSAERTILLSCGEASGDLYLSLIAEALRRRRPEWRLVGVVGPRSREVGVEAWGDIADLSVMGFGEVFLQLPRIWSFGRALVRRARAEAVDLFLPVDYPGFHLQVASRLRKSGIPVLDFIPPKTWSWGAWRLRSLRKAVDHCAVIFPFEEAHYRRAGLRADFVGHPLLQLHAARLEESSGRSRSGLLLVPGSRSQEIRTLTPVLLEAVARWREAGGEGPVRISRAPTLTAEELRPLREGIPRAEIAEEALFEEAMQAELAVVCSGTATMEAALAGCPHLIVYRTGRVSYAVARRLVTVPYIGMANIVLDRPAFPEFVQAECDAERIAQALLELGKESAARAKQVEAGQELCRRLRGPGCFETVAATAVQMVED